MEFGWTEKVFLVMYLCQCLITNYEVFLWIYSQEWKNDEK